MNNKPDPIVFARWSYILAIISALIIVLTLLFGFIRFPGSENFVQIVWLAMVTGGVGTFLGWAATSDFKKKNGPQESMDQARIGFRVNLSATVTTIVIAIFVIVVRILNASTIPVQ